MGMGIGNSGIGKNGNGNRFLSREWVGMGMGMVSWEWEGMGTEIVLPAHLYCRPVLSNLSDPEGHFHNFTPPIDNSTLVYSVDQRRIVDAVC